MTGPWPWIIACLGAYLAGSIPFGLLIGLSKGVDIRTKGSGNIGATNLGRVLGRRWGTLGFVLDVLKGVLPVLLAGWWLGLLGEASPAPGRAWGWMAIAACAILGHMFSVFLRFKGGKGVATGLGAMLGLWPHLTIPGALAGVVWIVSMKVCRIVSLSSCIAALSLPVWVLALRALWSATFDPNLAFAPVWPFVVGAALLSALVIYRHRANIARLRAGTEPRVGQGQSKAN